MTAPIWLAAVMVAFVAVGCVLEARDRRAEAETRRVEHQQLMREVRRQP